MNKILLTFLTSIFITACSHAPDPISWKKDLENIKAEPVNVNEIETKDIFYELNKKSVWK